MSFGLQDFFDFLYREGYVRWPEDGKCYYIPVDEMKQIMLEDIESRN